MLLKQHQQPKPIATTATKSGRGLAIGALLGICANPSSLNMSSSRPNGLSAIIANRYLDFGWTERQR
ncbi:MAG: hypothetical protein J0M03_21070 [Acidobacteria bacterium]|nr:hypothetical protein [Acidobacteriota bacterium]